MPTAAVAAVSGGLGLLASRKQSKAASKAAQAQRDQLDALSVELESSGFQGPGGFGAGVNFGGGTQGQFAQRPSAFGGFRPANSGFDPRGTQAQNGSFFSPGFLASQGGQDQFAQAGGAGFRGLNPQFFGGRGGRGGGGFGGQFGGFSGQGFGQQARQNLQQQGGNSAGFQLGDLEPSRQGLVGVSQQSLGRALGGNQQNTLGLLRAQARPFEQFAFDDLQERLFGQGNRNSSLATFASTNLVSASSLALSRLRFSKSLIASSMSAISGAPGATSRMAFCCARSLTISLSMPESLLLDTRLPNSVSTLPTASMIFFCCRDSGVPKRSMSWSLKASRGARPASKAAPNSPGTLGRLDLSKALLAAISARTCCSVVMSTIIYVKMLGNCPGKPDITPPRPARVPPRAAVLAPNWLALKILA